MDAQENVLQEEQTQEAAASVAPQETEVTLPADNETPAQEQKKVYESKEAVLERLKEIAQNEEAPAKDEIDLLKTVFYRFLHADKEAKQQAYLAAGGDPEKFEPEAEPAEEEFKAQMGIVKEKRQKLFQQQEKEKQENLKKKLDIIEKIKEMATSPEEANKSYQAFKALQQEWRELKAVPAEAARDLWRQYQHQVEQFYDLLKLNSEAREYDFKKNLEIKTKLCEQSERLAEEQDVISAFHQLQELHQQFRETGPVAKELREEIWNRFKAASTIVNKRYQQHFEDLRAQEEENLQKKTALCEKAEAINQEEIKTAADWDRLTKALIELQAEWKTIGFAPQKMNVKIFERFRAACDEFFAKKGEHFRQQKSQYAENAEKKRKLVEEAQSLQDSTDWKATADRLVELQKQWKTIGMVPRKLGDQLWNDFLAACNHFFEARNQAVPNPRAEERQNLEKKRAIIDELKALLESTADEAKEKAQELLQQYNEIGHVPFKEKDNIYNAFHEVRDAIYEKFDLSPARRRLDSFKSNLKSIAQRGDNALDSERTRLMRRYEQMKQEIQTYENNLGFLNAASKKGNSLVDEINRKVEKLKDEVKLLREKIKAIDASEEE